MRILLLPFLLVAACGSEAGQGPPVSGSEWGGGWSEASRAGLESAAGDGAVAQFYGEIGWRALWNAEKADQLREALGAADRHGLDKLRFLSEEAIGQDADPATREIALTRAALLYGLALAMGIADPADLYEIYTIPRPEAELLSGLRDALEGGDVRRWLDSLAPRDAEYAALSQAYRRLAERAGADDGLQIDGGDLIRAGDKDQRVPQIAALLRREGYLQDERAQGQGSGDATLYGPRIEQAVKRLQADRGIADDGVVGPDTVEALNRGAADRARAAAVALERRRWLRREPVSTRIDVNTAAAMLTYYREGSPVDRRKVIAGQPDWETPQLQSPIFRLVANPTWTVPKSIEEAELSNIGPAGLRRRNMERRDGWIVQLPGPDNALGLVKFDMDNDFAIYLHDTSSRSLFQRDIRQLSHGCVRVDDALGFARLLAQHQGITEEWQEARSGGEDTFLRLPRQLPVRLLYHPTYVGPSGDVSFAPDVYGWNGPIAERLGFGSGPQRRFAAENVDLGP